jgi:lysophospholipase L1-like esterase
MADLISIGLASKAIGDVTRLKSVLPPKLQPLPTVMTSSPTVVLGTANGTSQITNSVHVSSVNGSSTVPLYTYNGDCRVGSGYPDELFVVNKAVTTTNSFGSFSVEFCVDGTQFEWYQKGLGGRYRLSVDEGYGYQYVTATPQNAATQDGNLYYTLVTFSTRLPRKIRLEIDSGYFGGVRVGPNDTVFPVTRQLGDRAIFLGDSFTEGTGATASFTSYANVASQFLGWECWASGSGGTGYIATGSTGRVKYLDRVVHDVIGYNPDIVIVEGGTNDTASAKATVQVAATTLLQTIQAGLPRAKIFVLSNFSVQGTSAAITNTRDGIKAAALACKLPFIDSLAGITYDAKGIALTPFASGMWFTGSGNTGATQATGNASYYTFTDGGHPSPAGHRYLGERIASEIFRILNN